MKKIAIVIVGCYLASQGAAAQSGVTYYVSPAGSDSRSCVQAQSSSTPKRSVNSGLTCLQTGERLYVRGGTYAEALTSPSIASGGSWSNPTRIAAYPGEAVWLKPSASVPYVIELYSGQQYLEFDGINLDTTNAVAGNPIGGIALTGEAPYSVHHIRFKNATILGNRIAGDLGTSRPVVTVGATDPRARLGFDDDVVAMSDELTHAVWRQSDAILENLDLLRNAYDHFSFRCNSRTTAPRLRENTKS